MACSGACAFDTKDEKKYAVLSALALTIDSAWDYLLHLHFELKTAIFRHFGGEVTTPQSVKLVKAHLSDMVPALKVSWNCSVRIGDLGTEKVLPEIMVTAVPDDSIAFRKRSAPTLLRLLMSLGSPPIAQISDLGPSLGLIGVLQMGLAISILHAYEFSVLDGISFDTVAKCYDELIRRIMKCYKEDSIGRRAVSVEDYHAWFYCAESIHHVFTCLIAVAKRCPRKRDANSVVAAASRMASKKLKAAEGALQPRLSKAYRYLSDVLQFQMKPLLRYNKDMGYVDFGDDHASSALSPLRNKSQVQSTLNRWFSPSPRKKQSA